MGRVSSFHSPGCSPANLISFCEAVIGWRFERKPNAEHAVWHVNPGDDALSFATIRRSFRGSVDGCRRETPLTPRPGTRLSRRLPGRRERPRRRVTHILLCHHRSATSGSDVNAAVGGSLEVDELVVAGNARPHPKYAALEVVAAIGRAVAVVRPHIDSPAIHRSGIALGKAPDSDELKRALTERWSGADSKQTNHISGSDTVSGRADLYSLGHQPEIEVVVLRTELAVV